MNTLKMSVPNARPILASILPTIWPETICRLSQVCNKDTQLSIYQRQISIQWSARLLSNCSLWQFTFLDCSNSAAYQWCLTVCSGKWRGWLGSLWVLLARLFRQTSLWRIVGREWGWGRGFSQFWKDWKSRKPMRWRRQRLFCKKTPTLVEICNDLYYII